MRYPVLLLDDIFLYCNHDSDPDIAIQNWNRRAAKVILSEALPVFITDNPKSEKAFYQINRYQKKCCITPYESKNPHTIHMPPVGNELYYDAAIRLAGYSIGPCTVIDILLGNV